MLLEMFDLVMSLYPSQQFVSHLRTVPLLPGFPQYFNGALSVFLKINRREHKFNIILKSENTHIHKHILKVKSLCVYIMLKSGIPLCGLTWISLCEGFSEYVKGLCEDLQEK